MLNLSWRVSAGWPCFFRIGCHFRLNENVILGFSKILFHRFWQCTSSPLIKELWFWNLRIWQPSHQRPLDCAIRCCLVFVTLWKKRVFPLDQQSHFLIFLNDSSIGQTPHLNYSRFSWHEKSQISRGESEFESASKALRVYLRVHPESRCSFRF